VKVDVVLGDLASAAERAPAFEALGVDGVTTSETTNDPFLPLAVAAATTRRVELVTAVAVAFGRSPLTVAHAAHDLHTSSGGRLVLGLGTQVRAHVERRYSMGWESPAARIGEFVGALHAIWDTWDHGEPLRFDGRWYHHTLMTPAFSPQPSTVGRPPVLLAAVGPTMARTAGAVADGVICHSFSTPRYLEQSVLPQVRAGRTAAGRDGEPFQVLVAAFVATGRDPAEQAAAVERVRDKVAFYGSTPAYRAVFEAHGWGELGDELHALSRQGEWAAMARLVDDEVLEAFAVVAEPDHVGPALVARWGGVASRLGVSASAGALPEAAVRSMVAATR
jgi:probable F420-dependent oxidoreductase